MTSIRNRIALDSKGGLEIPVPNVWLLMLDPQILVLVTIFLVVVLVFAPGVSISVRLLLFALSMLVILVVGSIKNAGYGPFVLSSDGLFYTKKGTRRLMVTIADASKSFLLFQSPWYLEKSEYGILSLELSTPSGTQKKELGMYDYRSIEHIFENKPSVPNTAQ